MAELRKVDLTFRYRAWVLPLIRLAAVATRLGVPISPAALGRLVARRGVIVSVV